MILSREVFPPPEGPLSITNSPLRVVIILGINSQKCTRDSREEKPKQKKKKK
jgi:hypothetical protein